ncbi:PH domain-containing protein [Gelidibacter japonicus]|uniref:PH domain-containing protein n=1 Tax=Gelidibacter japonicus TaxID=1962232 RepID=UPI0020220DA7|nr:PH domain-containing protein [Gelidibacter japonicus]MCL8009498.1 PH domain-containing protein [Gelidibacter japonicus]
MSIYLSKSSAFVKIATIGTLILLTLILISLLISDNNYGIISGTLLTILTIGTAIYFYANSLNKIIVDKDYLILKKNFGQIKIPKNEINGIAKLKYSNLTMTYGSKGIFGFVGNTMDNSYSLVKDRKNMVKISTKNKKYIISSDEPDKLISEIKTLYNNV